MRSGTYLLVGCLGEHVSCNLVAVERSRSTGVGLNVDEKLDDLFFGDAISSRARQSDQVARAQQGVDARAMAPEQVGSFGDGQRSDGGRGHFEINRKGE